jgi:hypothetical protein
MLNPNSRMQNFEKSNNFKDSLDYSGKVSETVGKFDSKFLNWLVRFHTQLGKDKIDIGELGSLLEVMKHLLEDQKANYYEALLYPETAVAARIPRVIPVKGAAYNSTYEFRFPCSSLGTFAFIFDPYVHLVLGGTASSTTTFFLNNNNTLSGNGANNNFMPTTIPSWGINPIYSESCLVSHSVTVEAQVNSNTNNGTIVMGIVHDPTIIPRTTVSPVVDAVLAKYGDFSLARTGFFNDSINLNADTGIRSIGFPIDNSFEEFLNGSQETLQTFYRRGFAHVCTGVGLTSGVTIIVKIVCNWECLPDPAFVNVMPTSWSPSYHSSEEKSEAIKLAQRKPITPYSSSRSMEDNYTTPKEGGLSLWEKIKKFGRDYLPSIDTIATLVGGLAGGPIGEGIALGSLIPKFIGK